MTGILARNLTPKALSPLRAIVALCLLPAMLLAHPHKAFAAAHASDDFNQAKGSLGADWARIRGGGLSVSHHAVKGRSGLAGDVWTAGSFTSNQYSQIEVTPKQLATGQWIGAAVRVQHHGLDAYVGIYSWANGSPQLMLFKRSGGNWTQLGPGYPSGLLAAGTQLKVMAVGSTISLLENGVQRLWAADSSFSGGAPGIMTFGPGTTDNWSGGDLAGPGGVQVNYLSTDASGVKWYQTISAANAPGPQTLRVLTPTHPAPGVPHNFLYVLPVQAMLGNKYKDGLAALSKLDAQNRYNLTIIAPSFAIDPWYADNPTNPDVQYEEFMTKELVPWVEQHLSVTGHEQNWLLGFSKSGLGAEDLILKHPGIFAVAAAWDFPAGMSSYDQYGPDPAASYGTQANFQANYRLTPAFVRAHRGQFQTRTRIWIGGNREFPAYMSNYASLLTKEGVLYTRQAPQSMSHTWTSGWVPIALAALRHDSRKLPQSHTIKVPEMNNSAAGGTVSPYLIAAAVFVVLALCGLAGWAFSRRRSAHVAASADRHGAPTAGPPAAAGRAGPPGDHQTRSSPPGGQQGD
jgi:putative esterase